jgi:hypothetical protein
MELLVYKTFFEPESARALAEILTQNNIHHTITEDRESLDSLYGDKTFKKQYFVKIKDKDFVAVDSLLLEHSKQLLDDVDKEHYLFSFNSAELYDILRKPDEWTQLDVLLAQKILTERGVSVTQDELSKLKDERTKSLAKPDDGNGPWIYIGYLMAMLGGLFGVFIGWHLSTFKKTLPNGERVHGYSVQDRTHGNNILVIGVVMLLVWLSLTIFVF